MVGVLAQVRSERFWSFDGRAGRAEFWKTFSVFYVTLATIIVAWIAGNIALSDDGRWEEDSPATVGLIAVGISAFAWVTSPVSVRRLHDLGRSGQFIIWNRRYLVPAGMLLTAAGLLVIASGLPNVALGLWIAALVCLFPIHVALTLTLFASVRRSQPDSNPYGPNPSQVTP